MPECIAHRKLSLHENSVLDMSVSVCACVGVDVLYPLQNAHLTMDHSHKDLKSAVWAKLNPLSLFYVL